MKGKALGWMLFLLGVFASGAAADDCTYTPSPSDWQEKGRVYYRLAMDRTWLFVPTGHIQIQPIDFTFDTGGKVKVLANSAAVSLYADPDLHSLKGIEPSYPAGSGFLDYWFPANFQPGTASVVLTHTPNSGTPVPLSWTVNVQCGSPGGLGVAPESSFDIGGIVGGPFEPASRNYGLINSGSATISYSISVSYASASATGWLTLARTSGSLGAGQSGSFAANVNSSATGLAAGTYDATIEIRTSGSNPQTITRAVLLSIQPGPSLPPVISGRITAADGAPLEGVRMDGLPSVKWTNENGEYSVYVGTGWSGTVRPFKAGFSFSPATRTYSAVTAGVPGQDYTSTAKTYILSGRVTLNSAGLPGVAMTGLPGEPVTDDDGGYTTSVPFHWSGTVIPFAPGYVFSPGSMTYSEVGMDRVEENYLAARQTVTLSGRVTYGGSGLGGVWLNGLPGSVVTVDNGTYAATVPYGESSTVTPGANGYVFSPSSLDFADLVEDLPDQDFIASQAPPGSGHLWIVATSAELQQAAVFSLPGDMILVKPGTYLNANLGSLDPGTILVSEAGADQTILEVLQFVVNMSDVVIEGFTFRTTGTSEPLHINGSSNVRLRNCRIIAPGTTYGLRITNVQNLLIEGTVFSGYAGILLRTGTSSGTLTLRNNHFLNHTLGVDGGNNPSLQVILENNLFRNIVQEAVDLDKVGSLITRNNLFVSNGTGLDVSSITGSVQLAQDTMVGNGTAYDISGTISMVIYNSILQGNTRGIDGEAKATISVHHLMHWQNTSGWLYGSANYILDESTIWEVNPQFANASAADYHLAPGSPARGVGQGGADLGAYGGALGNAWRTPPGAPPAPPALLEIVITGPDRINPGGILSLVAKASFENGYSSPYATFNNVAQWSSSDPTVLESQGAGRFRAVRPGAAIVTASRGGVNAAFDVTVLAPALLLAVADTADPVTAGGATTYEILATNDGPGIARNLQVTAQYDARTGFVSASPAPDAGTTNRWTLGDLQPGETIQTSVTLNVDAMVAGATLSFSASATADFAAIVSASEATEVTGTPDLQIEANLTPAEAQPGEILSAALIFRNAGSAPVNEVVVEAVYPSGLDLQAAVPAPDSWPGTWFAGNLAPGEQRTFSLELKAAPSAAGTLVLAVEIRSSDAELVLTNNQATASVEILAEAADLDFYTLPPCRLLDTRPSSALVSQVRRLIPVAGLCGVPATARAVALNVTIISPSGGGFVSLWPADLPLPSTSTINFSAGQTRGNNAIVGLATDGGGDVAAQAFIAGPRTVHLILDVSGYFQ